MVCQCHGIDRRNMGSVLLVAGAPRDVELNELRALAEQANFIVAADSGGDVLYAAGLTPDVLIGDMDSIADETLEAYAQSGVALRSFKRDKDATDFDLALSLPEASLASCVTVVGALGGRVDHELGAIASAVGFALRTDVPIDIIHEQQTMHVLFAESSKRQSLAIPAELGAKTMAISAVAWGGEATVSIKGLRWELERARVSSNKTWGVSNEYNGSDVQITVHTGIALVILNKCGKP
jgi:thiamine pyrophosphokinase